MRSTAVKPSYWKSTSTAQAAEAAQRLTLEKAVYRDGTTLAQNVAPETYQLAAQRAKELGVDMRIMNPMKPWFVALTLVAIKLQSLGLDANSGVDRYLAQRAKNNGKATRELYGDARIPNWVIGPIAENRPRTDAARNRA